MDQAAPFQCSTSVWMTLLPPGISKKVLPTAQQSEAEVHVTPSRRLYSVALVLGEVTMDHAVPFQCSMSVWETTAWSKYSPTAQQSEAEVHVTPSRRLCSAVLVLGEGTQEQADPVQCAKNGGRWEIV